VLARIVARAKGGVSAAQVASEMNRLTHIVEDEYHANGVTSSDWSAGSGRRFSS